MFFSHPVMSGFVTPWAAACQASLSLAISQSLPKFISIASVMPSNHLILWCLLFLLPSVFPSIRDFSNESGCSHQGDQNTGASALASVISMSIQGWFPLRLTGDWSPSYPRDSRDSSPAPQFKSINSLAFCLLYSPALTIICGHWEDHNLDYTDICQQLYLCISTHCLGLS